MENAASVAYKKACKQVRDKEHLQKNYPVWMQTFAEKLPERTMAEAIQEHVEMNESDHHRKERELRYSTSPYERFSWLVYLHVTSTSWFEAFIMVNILLIGIATGVDLENTQGDPATTAFVDVVGYVTFAVFTIECVLKIEVSRKINSDRK